MHGMHLAADEEGQMFADEVFPALLSMLNNHKVSKYGRDNSMELIIKFVTKTDGVGWSMKVIDGPGECLRVLGFYIPQHSMVHWRILVLFLHCAFPILDG